MAKKKLVKPRREPTKRQLSHWERQKRRQRLILGIGVLVIVAVVVTLGVGWFTSWYLPMHETVIRVNDAEFNMRYYVSMLRYHGEGQPPGAMIYVANDVVQVIEQNELVRQRAGELGISVTDKEVDEERGKREPPLGREYREAVRAELMLKKLYDEYFEEKVPLSDRQRHILAMLLESESQVEDVRQQLESGKDFKELAGELSRHQGSRDSEGDFDWLPEGVLPIILGSSVLEESAFRAEVGVLGGPVYDEAQMKTVGYWLARVLERKADPPEAHVQAILLGSEAEALEVRARLEAGENFADIAKEYSQHTGSKDNSGDLGWLSPDSVIPVIEDFIFDTSIELKTLSQPLIDDNIYTRGGYWLFLVADEAEKEITEGNRGLLKMHFFDEWLGGLWDDPDSVIEDFLDGEKKAWAVAQVTA